MPLGHDVSSSSLCSPPVPRKSGPHRPDSAPAMQPARPSGVSPRQGTLHHEAQPQLQDGRSLGLATACARPHQPALIVRSSPGPLRGVLPSLGSIREVPGSVDAHYQLR
ncbi:hypothetical protein NDU88_002323 [Pleurodeles waltl]|uniref:Uncharacterized protein n=1 Tax=Pleurodeles waltl TaxID=8319 RepID=A0AAV7UWT8_PLEWA|nr:hypothetical protein NDU88_002323 [Pleurodeles waltl]